MEHHSLLAADWAAAVISVERYPIEGEDFKAEASLLCVRSLDEIGDTASRDPIGKGTERAACRVEVRQTPMDMEHQLLLDVLDLHAVKTATARVVANAGNDPWINAWVSVC
jgi:hypothetical protein